MTNDTSRANGAELVRFDKVTKRFGEVTVLDELDFSVATNKHVTLIGPSGSGKTTILRLLMTLLKPDEAPSPSTANSSPTNRRTASWSGPASGTPARSARRSAWSSSSSTSSPT